MSEPRSESDVAEGLATLCDLHQERLGLHLAALQRRGLLRQRQLGLAAALLGGLLTLPQPADQILGGLDGVLLQLGGLDGGLKLGAKVPDLQVFVAELRLEDALTVAATQELSLRGRIDGVRGGGLCECWVPGQSKSEEGTK